MGVGQGGEGVVVDRRDLAVMGEIEAKALACVGRAVGLLPVDGVGQLAEVEGEGGIVAAVGGVAGDPDVVELTIVNLLGACLRRPVSSRQAPRSGYAAPWSRP